MLVSDVIRLTRQYLGGDRDRLNRLDIGVDDTGTELEFEFALNGVQPGAILEAEDGEIVYVWAVDEGAQTATVQRGWDGTTPADHDAGSVWRVSPRFTGVREAMRQELLQLQEDGLFRMKTVDLDWDDDLCGLSLAGVSDMLGPVYAVQIDDGNHLWWLMPNQWAHHNEVVRVPYITGTYKVFYPSGFTAWTSDSDDLEADCGLHESAHELLAIGAAARLLAGRASDRVDHEAFTGARRPDDVSPQDPAIIARNLSGLRERRLASVLALQAQRWPYRSH